ncbi:hypothetical protein B4N84_21235 [Flavobacterium sp. IR1]|nr:hypothetical protein B4N84_21235 [Flavobacterium sp. IR1]
MSVLHFYNCNAQDNRIKLSEIINDIYFPLFNMKKTILLIFLCLVIQSCNSQKKDLSQITFSEKHDTFFGNIPNKFRLSIDAKTYTGYYKSEADQILNFNDVSISDYKNEKGGFGTNSVAFAFTKKDSVLCEYIVYLYTHKSIEKIISALNSKLGKAKFVRKFHQTDKLPDAYLWKNNHIIYLLNGASQHAAWLTVFDTNRQELYENRISGSFQYYYDYLEYLKKHQKTDKQISFYQYAKIEESEGSNYVINSYVKP